VFLPEIKADCFQNMSAAA